MALRRPFALAGAFVLVGLSPLLAQPGGNDTVKYRDRTKDGAEATKIGEVKESPAGVVILSAGKSVTISPADVIVVYYGQLAGVDDSTRQKLPQWDAKGGVETRNSYAELFKTVSAGTADERTKRYLEFKVAFWTARVADAKSGAEFKAEAEAAIEKLTSAAKIHTKSWEVWPAFRTAARLHAELGKHAEAATLLATLAKAEGLTPELQNEARLAELDMLLRSGNTVNVGPVLDALAKASGLTNTQQERLAVYQAVVKAAADKTDPAKVQVAVKGIRDLIEKMTDNASRAAAHNALGELYLMAKLPRDAMWEFLWVEAVYNQDRDEVVKALFRLAELFDAQGEKDRAATYREKLVKAKGA